jgi:hypothetical protein
LCKDELDRAPRFAMMLSGSCPAASGAYSSPDFSPVPRMLAQESCAWTPLCSEDDSCSCHLSEDSKSTCSMTSQGPYRHLRYTHRFLVMDHYLYTLTEYDMPTPPKGERELLHPEGL